MVSASFWYYKWLLVCVLTLCFGFSSADCTSTVHGLQSIFQEQEMTETVHDTEGHGHLATFVGKKGRSVEFWLSMSFCWTPAHTLLHVKWHSGGCWCAFQSIGDHKEYMEATSLYPMYYQSVKSNVFFHLPKIIMGYWHQVEVCYSCSWSRLPPLRGCVPLIGFQWKWMFASRLVTVCSRRCKLTLILHDHLSTQSCWMVCRLGYGPWRLLSTLL